MRTTQWRCERVLLILNARVDEQGVAVEDVIASCRRGEPAAATCPLARAVTSHEAGTELNR